MSSMGPMLGICALPSDGGREQGSDAGVRRAQVERGRSRCRTDPLTPFCAMPSHPDHEHHIRRVVLPSGKTIEVVYFEDGDRAEPAAHAELHRCPSCTSELVHPIAWDEAGPEHWDVLLRCPNCEWRGEGTWPQADIHRFDDVLDRGTECLLRDLRRLQHANMEDGIARWVAALGADLIVPDDF